MRQEQIDFALQGHVKRHGILFAGSLRDAALRICQRPILNFGLATFAQCAVREVSIVAPSSHLEIYRNELGHGARLGIELGYIESDAADIVTFLAEGVKAIAGFPLIVQQADWIHSAPDVGPVTAEANDQRRGAVFFRTAVTFGEQEGARDAPRHQAAHKRSVGQGPVFLDARAPQFASWVSTGSARHELPDLLAIYRNSGQLRARDLGASSVSFCITDEAGRTSAEAFINALEARQNAPVFCPEFTAYSQGWIERRQLAAAAKRHEDTLLGDRIRATLGAADIQGAGSLLEFSQRRA